VRTPAKTSRGGKKKSRKIRSGREKYREGEAQPVGGPILIRAERKGKGNVTKKRLKYQKKNMRNIIRDEGGEGGKTAKQKRKSKKEGGRILQKGYRGKNVKERPRT